MLVEKVYNFMKKHGLLPAPNSNAVIACSAGKDSCVLAHVLYRIKQSKQLHCQFSLAYFHHGNRCSQQDQEQLFIKKLASTYKMGMFSQKWGKTEENHAESNNFEQSARVARYKFLYSCLTSIEDRIYTAHHLQDSFEWGLMQFLGTSNPQAFSMIPVLNNQVARPFLMLNPEDIDIYFKENGLECYTDPTNTDTHYLRNFVRHSILPKIKERFPQYLKHYSNRFVPSPQVHCLGTNSESVVIEDVNVESVFKAQQTLASQARGPFQIQWKCMEEGIKNGKLGPYYFSGQTQFYYIPHLKWAFGYTKKFHESFLDNLICLDHVKTLTTDKLNCDLFRKCKAPVLIFNKSIKINEKYLGLASYKAIHPIYPRLSEYFIKSNIWFQLATHPRLRASNIDEVKTFLPCRIGLESLL